MVEVVTLLAVLFVILTPAALLAAALVWVDRHERRRAEQAADGQEIWIWRHGAHVETEALRALIREVATVDAERADKDSETCAYIPNDLWARVQAEAAR